MLPTFQGNQGQVHVPKVASGNSAASRINAVWAVFCLTAFLFFIESCNEAATEISLSRSTNVSPPKNTILAGATNLYWLIDYTGSVDSYGVPKLTYERVTFSIKKISQQPAGGRVVINYVDINPVDNIPLVIYVPAFVHNPKPVHPAQANGEAYFNERLKQYEKDSSAWIEDSLQYIKQIDELLVSKKATIEEFITKAEIEGRKYSRSNIIQAINHATDWFKSISKKDDSNDIVFCLSDLRDNMKASLNVIDPGIKFYQFCEGGKPPDRCIDAEYIPFLDETTIDKLLQK